jgi:glutamate---methylamine ligase
LLSPHTNVSTTSLWHLSEVVARSRDSVCLHREKARLMSLKTIARERGIKYFLVSYSDLAGTSRSKLVPAAAIDEICETGASFAGFATWLDLTPADPDIFAQPDPASLLQLPWKPEVGWLAADLMMNGKPLDQAPRVVLKKSLARAAELGYELRTGVEPEFFLLDPTGEAVGDRFDTQSKPCYDQSALMRRYDVIAEICDAIGSLGWEPYQNDHEDANGQFEINWKYADTLTTADRHTFFKFLVRSLAEKHGLRATFMPKPFSLLTGNGCHIHLSLWNKAQNANLFYDKADGEGLSPLAYQFMSGVLEAASALCAVIAPTFNSYHRLNAGTTLSGATWSPSTASFTGNNRTHMIRIPDAGRFEVRLSDGSANPYLLPAAVLEAGLDGVARKLSPGQRSDTNAYVAPSGDLKPLPTTLLEAIRAFESHATLRERLGSAFSKAYLKLKQAEWLDAARQVSAWERTRYMDC